MLHDLCGQGMKVHAVLFDYQQKHIQELKWAKYHCEVLRVLWTEIKLPQIRGSSLTDGGGSVIVPNRNAIMLSHAVSVAVAANADTITIACNADDEETFPDCRKAFIATMNSAVKSAGYNVEICAPYIEKRKWWIMGIGQSMGVNLNHTWSCYEGGSTPCGKCPACEKRHVAIHGHTKEKCACSDWK